MYITISCLKKPEKKKPNHSSPAFHNIKGVVVWRHKRAGVGGRRDHCRLKAVHQSLQFRILLFSGVMDCMRQGRCSTSPCSLRLPPKIYCICHGHAAGRYLSSCDCRPKNLTLSAASVKFAKTLGTKTAESRCRSTRVNIWGV